MSYETMTNAEKLAFVKDRAAAEPVIQDMALIGHPLDPALQELFMGEAIVGGEHGVRRFIDGLRLGPAAAKEASQ